MKAPQNIPTINLCTLYTHRQAYIVQALINRIARAKFSKATLIFRKETLRDFICALLILIAHVRAINHSFYAVMQKRGTLDNAGASHTHTHTQHIVVYTVTTSTVHTKTRKGN